jgi:hypothetical protein
MMATIQAEGARRILLQGQVVLVFAACALSDPENDGRKHEGDTLRNVGVAIVRKLLRVSVQDVFEDKDSL